MTAASTTTPYLSRQAVVGAMHNGITNDTILYALKALVDVLLPQQNAV